MAIVFLVVMVTNTITSQLGLTQLPNVYFIALPVPHGDNSSITVWVTALSYTCTAYYVCLAVVSESG